MIYLSQQINKSAGHPERYNLTALIKKRKGKPIISHSAKRYNAMYNYLESIKEDVMEYIKNEVNYSDYETIEDLYQFLNVELWTEDSVTGNASGSYTFCRNIAKDYVTDNMDECVEALKDFCVPSETIAEKFLCEDWEYFDVTIRCHLLGEAISEAMEEIEKDFDEAHEENEEE